MVTLITGKNGEGKTKKLIELTNAALENSSGSIIVIDKGSKLNFDISYKIRLVDTKRYNVDGVETLYGCVCGVCASNYDATDIFIESALEICGNSVDEFGKFVGKINELSDKTNINITISVSTDKSDISDDLRSICNIL